MTLNQMIYFQTIAKHEHFRLAAAELNLSQPSLSRSIATLEEELGVILFERKGRNVALTKSGKLFLEHVNRILDEVTIAQKQMQKLSGNAGTEYHAASDTGDEGNVMNYFDTVATAKTLYILDNTWQR